jgi:serine protease AprX
MRSQIAPRLAAACTLALLVAACGTSSPLGGGTGAGGQPPIDAPPAKACTPPGETAEERINALADGVVGEFVVTFEGKGPLTALQKGVLKNIDVPAVAFRRLPIAGVLATRAQAQALLRAPGVRSVRFNDPLSYEDEEANVLTSVTQASTAPELVNANGEPITGKGIGVLVNDSGIDGTHADLLYPLHTIQNTIGHTNLRAILGNNEADGYDETAPFTPVEGFPNTDFGGSHGSHVAGIVAGDGTLSFGRYVGAAPGASLIGYGSGAALFVLDALGGFDYALQVLDEHPEYNLRVVTNSFGTTSDVASCFDPADPTNVATKMLADRNIIVVFSAGNSGNGPDTITGNYKKAPWIITVANALKSGLLETRSSRGSLVQGPYEVEVDGETFVVEDRPTVAAPGTSIISARATAVDPLAPLDTADDILVGDIPLNLLPFYTHKTGTSMSAPHVAGLVALMLEADPSLTWREIKPILKRTATNMVGYEPWEVGAGLANVQAALEEVLHLRNDYGLINNTLRTFNATIGLGPGKAETIDLQFSPVGEPADHVFEVGPEVSLVIAQWSQPLGNACTCGLTLIDPEGTRYGSAIAIPAVGPNIAASAPGMEGTWTLHVAGVGGLNVGPGIDLEPLNLTNGYAGPSRLEVRLQQFAAGIPQGLDDTVGRADRAFIEVAVNERLVDGLPGGFQPDAPLTRGQMAQYLTGWGLRQTRATHPGDLFADTSGVLAAAAEVVTQSGAPILDLSLETSPLMFAETVFDPETSVTREEMAYALIQALGHESALSVYDGVTMFAPDAEDNAVPVVDADEVKPQWRNHVQDALAMRVLDAEFFDDNGTKKARIHPKAVVTRAGYAVASSQAYLVVPFPVD